MDPQCIAFYMTKQLNHKPANLRLREVTLPTSECSWTLSQRASGLQ